MLTNWKLILTRILLALWGLQIIWLCWHFAPEAREMGQRLLQSKVGTAIRQEDPLYRWSLALAALMPENATYVFLDNYEAGKEILVRYLLAPRRHLLLPPQVPAGFLFYKLHQERATFLILRDQGQPLGPGVLAARQAPACHPVDLPGPGLVWRVAPDALPWGFYD